MGALDVRLFGRFTVRRGEQVLTSLRPGKVQELFCYLLLYRDRPHHRELLADALFGGGASVRSRKCLRQALWQLQAILVSETRGAGHTVLLVEPNWLQVNPDADLWLDVAEFEEAFSLGHGVVGQELDSEVAQALQNAAQLYHGDLLEGWYQDWCVYERGRLQQMYLAMLDKLMDYCEAQEEYESGLVYGGSGLRYDRARERTHRRLMRLYYLSGDRTGALRQYERCLEALEKELSVRPDTRTAALYQRIRADQLGDSNPS